MDQGFFQERGDGVAIGHERGHETSAGLVQDERQLVGRR